MRIYIAGQSDAAHETASALRSAGFGVTHQAPSGSRLPKDWNAHDLIVVFEESYLDSLGSQPNRLGTNAPVSMAHAKLADAVQQNERVHARIDDLFQDADDLLQRMPYVARRIELRESRSREYAAIFELTVDGIIVINRQGVVVAYNKAAEKIFGYSSEDVVGENVSMLMPEPYKSEHDEYIDRYIETGTKKIIGIGREVTGRRKNGDIFPMDLAVSEIPSDGGILFTGLIRDITDRRELEHEILRISEQERRRIGQDLHDGLGQMLTGLGLITKNLAKRLKKEDSEVAEEIEEVSGLIHEADQMARNLARGLVPVELQGDGFSSAMLRLSKNVERLFGVSCEYEEHGELDLDDSSTASNLYRIVQEAVSNAVKHGEASNVKIVGVSETGRLTISVLDDGIGFPEELGDDRGMGVQIMGYRARVIGAVLEISNRSEGGTAVTCTLSFQKSLQDEIVNTIREQPQQ